MNIVIHTPYNEATTWKTDQDKVYVSYDVVHLHHSVSIDKAIHVLVGTFLKGLD